MIDKSMGLKRVVDGIEFYGGLHSKDSIIGEFNGKEIYISSSEISCCQEYEIDNIIRYKIMKVKKYANI